MALAVLMLGTIAVVAITWPLWTVVSDWYSFAVASGYTAFVVAVLAGLVWLGRALS